MGDSALINLERKKLICMIWTDRRPVRGTKGRGQRKLLFILSKEVLRRGKKENLKLSPNGLAPAKGKATPP